VSLNLETKVLAAEGKSAEAFDIFAAAFRLLDLIVDAIAPCLASIVVFSKWRGASAGE
jgi:hypothetical protein